jgi:hypothetical protein
MAKYSQQLPDLGSEEEINLMLSNNKIVVLRPLNFFYTEQETDLLEMKKFYTNKAIAAFFNDGFIKDKPKY